jgi:uncharacterized coiled-coil protein SlyX
MTTNKNDNINFGYSAETRVALLEQSINNINNTMLMFEKCFERIEEKFDRIDEKFDRIDEKFERVNEKFERMDDKMNSNFRWLLGIMITLNGSLFALIAHGFHWI